MYKNIEDCCKNQRHIKKLTRPKKEKKRTIDIDDECEDKWDEGVREVVKKRSVRTRYVSEIDRVIERIKPSVSVRDDYSFSRHTRCVTESPIKDRMSRNSKGNSAELNNPDKNKTQKKRGKRGRSTRVAETEAKTVKSRKSEGNGKVAKPSEGSSTDSDSSSDCDEICSIDSDINLSGVTLTVEDQATVMNNYAESPMSPTNANSLMNNSDNNEKTS